MAKPTTKVTDDEINAATFATPIFLYAADPLAKKSSKYSYFYNGHLVYCYFKDVIRPLPQIDIHSFKARPYGIADSQHVVVGDCVHECPASGFKRVGKHGHFYFVQGADVFTWHQATAQQRSHLQPIPELDGKTLKVVDEDFATDANWLWFFRNLPGIRKSALGNYQVCDYDWMLLESENGVFLAGQRLDIEANALRWVRKDDTAPIGAIFHGQDAQGDIFILVKRQPEQPPIVEVMRDRECVAAVKANWKLQQAKQAAEKAAEKEQARDVNWLRTQAQNYDLLNIGQQAWPMISAERLMALDKACTAFKDDPDVVSRLRELVMYGFQFYLPRELDALVRDNPDQASFATLHQTLMREHMLQHGPTSLIDPWGSRQWKVFMRHFDTGQLSPLVYLRMANLCFLEAHGWASWKYTYFEQTRAVLSQRLNEAAQLIGYVQAHYSLDAELLTQAEDFALVAMMQRCDILPSLSNKREE